MTYTVPEGFAGSILNLEPATSYECEFTLKDPDGVTGAGAATGYRGHAGRAEIVLGRARPPRLSSRPWGPKQEPSFIGIKRPTTAKAAATGLRFA